MSDDHHHHDIYDDPAFISNMSYNNYCDENYPYYEDMTKIYKQSDIPEYDYTPRTNTKIDKENLREPKITDDSCTMCGIIFVVAIVVMYLWGLAL